MTEKTLSIPEIAQLAGTRVVLGVGIGLILADKLNGPQRRSVGWTLLAIEALSTIPIAANVLSKQSEQRVAELDRVAA